MGSDNNPKFGVVVPSESFAKVKKVSRVSLLLFWSCLGKTFRETLMYAPPIYGLKVVKLSNTSHLEINCLNRTSFFLERKVFCVHILLGGDILWSGHGFPGWNFNLSSREKFHPTITWRNDISSRKSGTGFRIVFV